MSASKNNDKSRHPRLIKTTRFILFFIGTLLFLDCLILFTFKKFNFGTIVPFLIALVFIFHSFYWQHIQTVLAKNTLLHRIWRVLWLIFITWLLSFIIFIIILQQQIENRTTVTKFHAMIILGAGVVDGKPSLALANRLDSAAPFIRKNPNAVIITSGGIGLGKNISEAHIMAIYLHRQHRIGMSRIYEEKKSTSTEENLLFSQQILSDVNISLNQPIAIITNDFHSIRAKAIATKLGYQNVETIISDTPWSIRFNAWFREYFAFLSGWIFNEY